MKCTPNSRQMHFLGQPAEAVRLGLACDVRLGFEWRQRIIQTGIESTVLSNTKTLFGTILITQCHTIYHIQVCPKLLSYKNINIFNMSTRIDEIDKIKERRKKVIKIVLMHSEILILVI